MKNKFIYVALFMMVAVIFQTSCNKSETTTEVVSGNLSATDLTNVGITAAEISSGYEFNFGNYNTGFSLDQNKYLEFNNSSNLTTFDDDNKESSKDNRLKSRNFPLDGNSLIIPNDTFAAIFTFANLNESYQGFNFVRYGQYGPTMNAYKNGLKRFLSPYFFPMSGYGNAFGYGANGYKFGGLIAWLNLDSLLNNTVDSIIFDWGTGKTFVSRSGDTISRSGSIGIYVSYNASTKVFTKTIKFNDFKINKYGINGSNILTRNLSITNDSNISYTINSNSSGTISIPSGAVYNISGSRTKTIFFTLRMSPKGYRLPAPFKGGDSTTVNTSVTDASGSSVFTYNTSSPIVTDYFCFNRVKPTSGLINGTYLTNTFSINFSGNCGSRTIVFTLNGLTYTKTITNNSDNDDDD